MLDEINVNGETWLQSIIAAIALEMDALLLFVIAVYFYLPKFLL